MSGYYKTSPNHGFSPSHNWHKSGQRQGFWWVGGNNAWCVTGYAVVDDFGNLVCVEVTQ